ncbi:MAG: hypothetical protein JXP34_09270 [Planctomycetes bacterium]|nr:hypothetical protein [Planctomycetota bacterium]
MAVLVPLLALLAGPVRSDSAWRDFEGHRYRLTPAPMDWETAEKYAQKLGGHLAAVNTAAEQRWLVATFRGHGSLWIGFTDKKNEGTWRWTTGEPVTYTHWGDGEPNNQSEEDYGQMKEAYDYTWNDVGTMEGPILGIVEVGEPGAASDVPPGMMRISMRDGCVFLAKVSFRSVRLRTAFGTLEIPADEIRAISFDGARILEGEVEIAAARLTAPGALGWDLLEAQTRYGRLRAERDDIRYIRMGPPRTLTHDPPSATIERR